MRGSNQFISKKMGSGDRRDRPDRAANPWSARRLAVAFHR